MSEDKIIVTILGKDGVGIVAEIANVLAKYDVNIEDIRQTIMQGCFCMILLSDISKANTSFKELKESIINSGKNAHLISSKKSILHLHKIYNYVCCNLEYI